MRLPPLTPWGWARALLTSRPFLMAAAFALTLGLATALLHLGAARADRDRLTAAIADPERGYVRQVADANERLGACRSTVASLNGALELQNRAFAAKAAEDAAKLDETRRLLAEARAAAGRARAKAAAILGRPLSGATVCERYEDVDRRLLESLG